MNLIDVIKSQLSSGLLNQLSSLIGAGEGATKSAVAAAVPALLQALSGLASSGGGGAQKLLSAVGKFDSGSLANVAHLLSDDPAAVEERGSGLLDSLLGGSLTAGIANAVGRFAGVGSAA